jgi:hypothetical protein
LHSVVPIGLQEKNVRNRVTLKAYSRRQVFLLRLPAQVDVVLVASSKTMNDGITYGKHEHRKSDLKSIGMPA